MWMLNRRGREEGRREPRGREKTGVWDVPRCVSSMID